MAKITNKSIVSFLASTLRKLVLKDAEYEKLRRIIDRAQYDCCTVVTVYWISGGENESNATPAAYQLRFKDADGNVVKETTLDGPFKQTVVLPQGQYQICLNVLQELSPLPGGEFQITDSNGGFYQANDAIAEHCDPDGLLDLASTYFISNFPGSPE